MNLKYLIIILLTMSSLQIIGQDIVFSSEVNTDQVDTDEVIELTFMIKGGAGDFKAPSFKDFTIASGPNVQSSIEIINGIMTQEKKYTYYLSPVQTGELIIEEATLTTEFGLLTTPEIIINANGDNKDFKGNSKQNEKNTPKRIRFDKKSIKRI